MCVASQSTRKSVALTLICECSVTFCVVFFIVKRTDISLCVKRKIMSEPQVENKNENSVSVEDGALDKVMPLIPTYNCVMYSRAIHRLIRAFCKIRILNVPYVTFYLQISCSDTFFHFSTVIYLSNHSIHITSCPFEIILGVRNNVFCRDSAPIQRDIQYGCLLFFFAKPCIFTLNCHISYSRGANNYLKNVK